MPTTQAQAVNSIATELNSEFQDLTNLMSSVATSGSNGTSVNTNLAGIAIQGKVTDPGTMLEISTATSVQSVYTGQLTDVGMKSAQLQKQTAQKIG